LVIPAQTNGTGLGKIISCFIISRKILWSQNLEFVVWICICLTNRKFGMHSDCFFFTGKSHNICEDYSRCGQIEGLSYAIVSDGCSSSENTDIGARILTCAAEKHIQNIITPDKFSKLTIDDANNICFNFPGIGIECLDATLLTVLSDTFCTWIRVFGDGVIVFINNDDSIKTIELEYPSGAPKYISYLLNKDRENNYMEKYGAKYISREIFIEKSGVEHFIKENDLVSDTFSTAVLNNTCKAVLLMSDGIKSFSKKVVSESSKGNIPVAYQEVIKELLPFKGYQGEFIKRRVKRFIKDMNKLGWENYDDVSIAGIYLGEEK